MRSNRALLVLLVAAACGVQARADELHDAAEAGNLNRVKELLDGGADVNAVDGAGVRPLEWAVAARHERVAALLLARGADPSLANERSETPLHTAAHNDLAETVVLLLTKGADVKARDTDGRTPLHHATSRWSPRATEALLANGADANARDKSGRTALHGAARGNYKPIMAILLKNGADPNAVDNAGMTPLHAAIDRNAFPEVALLVAKGADVNAPDNDGQTPLGWAILHAGPDIAALLVARGGEVVSAKRGPTARDVLDRMPSWDRKKVRELGFLLADADVAKRRQAAAELAKSPSEALAEGTFELLLAAAGDEDVQVRRDVARALTGAVQNDNGWRPARVRIVLQLCKLAKDRDAEVRRRAVLGMGFTGLSRCQWKYESIVLHRLVGAIKDPDPAQRRAGVQSLGRTYMAIEHLRHNERRAFKHLKPVNRARCRIVGPCLPDVIGYLRSEDASLRRAAANCLGYVAHAGNLDAAFVAAAVDALGRASGDESRAVRLAALVSLREIGPRAEAAVPAMLAAFQKGDGLVRRRAALALGAVGQEAGEAVPALLRALKDENPKVRASAAEALTRIARDVPEVMKAVEQAKKKQD